MPHFARSDGDQRPISGAAPPDTPDDPSTSHAPWGSVRADWEADGHRQVVAALAAQNPERYGIKAPRRDRITVWGRDAQGNEVPVGTRRVHSGRLVRAAGLDDERERDADALRELMGDGSQPSPSSSFL